MENQKGYQKFEKSRLVERNADEHTDLAIKQFILSVSKGLAETTRSKDHTVQFIHTILDRFIMGSKDILKLLLRAGKVDINSQDLNGRTTIILGRRARGFQTARDQAYSETTGMTTRA
ncbi:hypothetical protein M432DRAFT_591594 [Thermoascus aurantiacus ATCC 26904]